MSETEGNWTTAMLEIFIVRFLFDGSIPPCGQKLRFLKIIISGKIELYNVDLKMQINIFNFLFLWKNILEEYS